MNFPKVTSFDALYEVFELIKVNMMQFPVAVTRVGKIISKYSYIKGTDTIVAL